MLRLVIASHGEKINTILYLTESFVGLSPYIELITSYVGYVLLHPRQNLVLHRTYYLVRRTYCPVRRITATYYTTYYVTPT